MHGSGMTILSTPLFDFSFDSSWFRHAHNACQCRKTVDLVRNCHRIDEVLLELRLDRRLDLFDTAHKVFYFTASSDIE